MTQHLDDRKKRIIREIMKINDVSSLEAIEHQTGANADEGWTHIATYAARVLDFGENFVKTEVLMNKEEGKYQVRNIPRQMFDTQMLSHGKLIQIFHFIKSNEMKVRIEDGENLVNPSDFPENNLFDSVKDLDMFKFK